MGDTLDTPYPKTYRAWRRVPMRARPRRAARDLSLRALYARWRAGGFIEQGLSVPRVQFYCLHHLFPDEENPFRQLLETLSQTGRFASWSEGVRLVREGTRPDQPVYCFSSDDGFESNLRLARVLEDFGATGCFFVNPASLVESDPAWVADFCGTRLEANPAPFLSESDVEDLLGRGHEIGNHTVTHVVCSETPADRLEAEIRLGQQWLEARFGPVLHFAWPYGQPQHFSETARRLVFESGAVSASSVVRGAHLLDGGVAIEEPILLRDQLWAADPISHALYFTARNGLHEVVPPERFGASAPSGLAPWDAVSWPF